MHKVISRIAAMVPKFNNYAHRCKVITYLLEVRDHLLHCHAQPVWISQEQPAQLARRRDAFGAGKSGGGTLGIRDLRQS